MGLRTAGLACAGLWMGVVAAAQDAAPLDVPPALGRLLAAVTGATATGPLLLTGIRGSVGTESGLARIGTVDGVPLLTVAVAGGRMDGESFRADRVELWRDEPLLSGDGVRVAVDGARISAAAERILHTGGFGRLVTALSAGRTSATVSGTTTELTVELDSPAGRIGPADRTHGSLAWTAGRAVFRENPGGERPLHLRMESIAMEMGAGRTAGAGSLEIEADPGGAWHLKVGGLAVSAGLADRFRPISGLAPPPVSLEMSVMPEGPSGRRAFNSLVRGGTAVLRIDGWLGGRGEGGVTRADAAGLLRWLADAGSADPLASAAAMGLHYDQDGQDADRTSWRGPP